MGFEPLLTSSSGDEPRESYARLASGRQDDGAKALIIEDDRDTAESMAQVLKLYGHDAQIARDGFEAIAIARRQRPDYVLLDLGLPGLDGYEVATRLRQELAEPIVIIAITGYGREEDRRRACAAGVDHYFLKPIDVGALITLLSASSPGSPPHVHAGPPSEAMGREGHPILPVRRQVEITNPLGLHLRAAAKFVSLVQRFRADVRVVCGGREASGRSVLDLAILAAACGSRLELEAEGPDAEAALDALSELIRRGFGEES